MVTECRKHVDNQLKHVIDHVKIISEKMEAVEKYCTVEPQVRVQGAYEREGQLGVKLEESQVPEGSITRLNHQRIGALSPGLNYDAPAFGPQSSEPYGNSGGPIKRKPQEFDGKDSWETYRVQFELLANQNGWDDRQRAVQLATSLKGASMEILVQLSVEERNSYRSLVEVLERRYGTIYQTEVYRARFRSRVRARGEPLQQLAHDLESMAQKAYPGAAPNMLVIFLMDQFIDALDTVELKVKVKQAQPRNMQEAIARALEFESYVSLCFPSSPNTKKRTAIDSVRVDGRIDGKKCYLVIDSASEQTFVRPDVLHHRYLPESSEQLCGVTGHCAELKGPLEVRIEVAGQEATLPVYVAEMEDQCLLGLDYLLFMGCELNFSSMKLKVRGKSVPITAARHNRSGGEVSSSFDSNLGIVEPDIWSKTNAGVIVERNSVETSGGEVPVVVANFFLEPQMIKEEYSKKCNRTAVTGLVSAEEDLSYWSRWDLLRLDNGLLERQWETPDGLVKYWQLVVPKKLWSKILNESHNQITSGHLGVKKTLSRLRQRFYWMGIRQEIEEWCRACDVCCAKKGPKKRGCAPLQQYQVRAPMERVTVDIAGPLPRTDKGNRYICVAMDYFTKWPEAYAIPDQEAATVAQVLVDQFFCRFGMPQELHSDQGRNFEPAVFCESCKLLGIKQTRTTPPRPQSDEMVEKFNWTLGQELAKYCVEGQSEWEEKLPALLMAYRSAAHESTGYTPAKLILGHELRLPVDVQMGRPPGEELPTDTSSYAKHLQERLAEVYHQRKKGQSPKLQSPWDRPYTVLDRLSDVTYRIRGGRKSRPRVVHVNYLWQYHGPGQYSWDGSEESCSPADEDVEEDIGVEVQEDGDGLPREEVDQQEDQDLQGADCVEEQGQRRERQRRRPDKFKDYFVYD
ncbi:hypothetical protein Pcinc_001229 [Petrolisthes cinctipes]|uniref:RNA-directed DNA polymerase n=1 Tax=Petrolisthes cinctipes TaxID=88211 RepID=A0AAE1GNE4_PETCI|nr:hypothetical protein Pcinc_001229 [Petrolisthes cinctipes]